MQEECYSEALTTPISLSHPEVVQAYVKHFARSLSGPPDRYAWRLVSEGDVLYIDTKDEPVYAECDYVRLIALRDIRVAEAWRERQK
jgi:hypothetical protein